MEKVFQGTDGWYFINEKWHYVGPFETKEKALRAYGDQMEELQPQYLY